MLSEYCSLLGTDNVRGQIREHIFAPGGGYCLNIYFEADRPSTCKCVLYSFHRESVTWEESRQLCQKNGGDLASMETDKEWKYLTEFIQNLAGSNHSEYFIGLSNKSGSWRWLSNISIEVPGQKWRWHNGQPSGDGDCAVMYEKYSAGNNPEAKRTKGYFNDLPCTLRGAKGANTGFICEKIVGKRSLFQLKCN